MTSRAGRTTRSVADTNGVLHGDKPEIAQGQAVESRLPVAVRFPLVVLSTFFLNALLNTLSAEITGPELAAVSTKLTEGWQIGALAGFKLTELALAWYACYDCEYYARRLDRGAYNS
jgi:hypothetical protein